MASKIAPTKEHLERELALAKGEFANMKRASLGLTSPQTSPESKPAEASVGMGSMGMRRLSLRKKVRDFRHDLDEKEKEERLLNPQEPSTSNKSRRESSLGGVGFRPTDSSSGYSAHLILKQAKKEAQIELKLERLKQKLKQEDQDLKDILERRQRRIHAEQLAEARQYLRKIVLPPPDQDPLTRQLVLQQQKNGEIDKVEYERNLKAQRKDVLAAVEKGKAKKPKGKAALSGGAGIGGTGASTAASTDMGGMASQSDFASARPESRGSDSGDGDTFGAGLMGATGSQGIGSMVSSVVKGITFEDDYDNDVAARGSKSLLKKEDSKDRGRPSKKEAHFGKTTSTGDSADSSSMRRQNMADNSEDDGSKSDDSSKKGGGLFGESIALREKMAAELAEDEEDEDAANMETATGKENNADYQEFLKTQKEMMKYLRGDVKWYRFDHKLMAWVAKQKFGEYEKNLGLKRRTRIQKMVDSLQFDLFFGFMIILNAITMAGSTNFKTNDGKPPQLIMAEHFFTGIFVIEFFLRVRANGWFQYFDVFNFIDFCLVWVTGVLSLWILEPLGAKVPILRGLIVFRIFRLVRVCRDLRMVPGFKELWMLVQGVYYSMGLIFWIFVVGFVVLVFFSIYFMDLLGATKLYHNKNLMDRLPPKDPYTGDFIVLLPTSTTGGTTTSSTAGNVITTSTNHGSLKNGAGTSTTGPFDGTKLENTFCGLSYKNAEFCHRYFSSLGGSMFTLMQMSTFDAWAKICRLFFNSPPHGNEFFLLAVTSIYVVFMGIVFVNLISGIVIQQAFYSGERDRDATKRRAQLMMERTTSELIDIFLEVDKDGSGELSKSEFANLLSDAKFMTKMRILDIEAIDLPDIFRICDDGDGAVTAVEFCTGLMKMLKLPTSLDLLGVTRTARILEKSLNYIREEVEDGILKGRFQTISGHMTGIQKSVTKFLEGSNRLIQTIYECDIQHAVEQTLKELPTIPMVPLDLTNEETQPMLKLDTSKLDPDADGILLDDLIAFEKILEAHRKKLADEEIRKQKLADKLASKERAAAEKKAAKERKKAGRLGADGPPIGGERGSKEPPTPPGGDPSGDPAIRSSEAIPNITGSMVGDPPDSLMTASGANGAQVQAISTSKQIGSSMSAAAGAGEPDAPGVGVTGTTKVDIRGSKDRHASRRGIVDTKNRRDNLSKASVLRDSAGNEVPSDKELLLQKDIQYTRPASQIDVEVWTKLGFKIPGDENV